MRANRSLFLAADQETVVEEGDERAFSLLVARGSEIGDADAAKYGVTFEDDRPKAEKPADDAPPATTVPARQDQPFQAPPKADEKGKPAQKGK